MRILQFVLVALLIASLSYWFGEVVGRMQAKGKAHEEVVKPIRTYVESTMHKCIDPQHYRCDGECLCDGMDCRVLKRDYQLELYHNTVWTFDGSKLVGRYITNWYNQINSILLKDNQ